MDYIYVLLVDCVKYATFYDKRKKNAKYCIDVTAYKCIKSKFFY